MNPDSPTHGNPSLGSGDSAATTPPTLSTDGPVPTVPSVLVSAPRPPEVPGHDLVGLLGRGGMGVVYQARHRVLGRTVAVKLLLLGEHADAHLRDRFLSEARAVARLQHPNIVQIYEIGEVALTPYFCMEFCPGGSLAGRLAASPFLPEEAARLVAILARAVQTAHDAGIIHRDLKPGNVLLAADGTVKLADFGLARQMDAARSTSGAVIGSPPYMAPEQARGNSRAVGPATDVYGLGAILYELLVGRPPFQGATLYDVLEKVVHELPIDPRQLRVAVPAGLAEICLHCLEKDPLRRPASAAQLADALDHWLANPTRRPRRRRSSGWFAAAAVLSLVTALIVAGVIWRSMSGRPSPGEPPRNLAVPLAKAQDVDEIIMEEVNRADRIEVPSIGRCLLIGAGDLDRPGPAASALALAQRLGGLTSADSLRLLLDRAATRETILAELDDLAANPDGASVFVYLAGTARTTMDAGREFLFRTADADGEPAELSGAELLAKLAGVGRRVYLVVDTDHAGALLQARSERLLGHWRHPPLFLLGCGSGEQAAIDPVSKQGVFSLALLEAFSPGTSPADTDRNGVLTAEELARFLQTQLARRGEPPGQTLVFRRPGTDGNQALFSVNRESVSDQLSVTPTADGQPAPPAAGSRPELYGLFVGINDFSKVKSDRVQIRDLLFAKADATALHDVFAQQKGKLYTATHLTLLTDQAATRRAILDRLQAMAGKIRSDDQLIVALSGHATTSRDHTGEGSWCYLCTDSKSNDQASFLHWQEVLVAMRGCRGRCCFVLDCGIVERMAEAAEKALPAGRWIILGAGRDGQIMEPNEEGARRIGTEHGLFTAALLEALQARPALADENNDGVLDAAEVFDYTREWVPRLLKRLEQPADVQVPVMFPRGEAKPMPLILYR